MNRINMIVIIPAMFLLSTQVFANETIHDRRVIKTAFVATKSAAYELAMDKLNSLHSDTSEQLNKDLGNIVSDSRTLVLSNGGYITVIEQINSEGKAIYRGLVNINVSYDVTE